MFKKSKKNASTLIPFIEASPIPTAKINANAEIVFPNRAMREILKLDNNENHDSADGPNITHLNFRSLLEEDKHQLFDKLLEQSFQGEYNDTPLLLELHLPNESSEEHKIITVSLYFNSENCTAKNGESLRSIMLIDISEQKNLEMRFAHSQKMQAIGQLAGGVAHDFNNLLTAMLGFCDLLLMRHPAGDPSFADIMQVKQNANRAANLVRQLLAFSRRQTLQPKTLDITELLAELSNLIRRLIGENITLNMTHGRNIGYVKADQGQLEQVIINLAVNARDAMKGGGNLDIRSSHVKVASSFPLTGEYISPEEDDIITPGEYILVEIEDSGDGIPGDLITKVFEPFFSTKEVGHGTGLGLATVYGIIKQTGGYVYVKSEQGKGTNFALFFPQYIEDNIADEGQKQAEEKITHDLTGAATIMLVEDETPVRIFAARALRNKGYEVLEADSGENGIEVFSENLESVDIIVTDVIMPSMNGPTMIETLEQKYPEQMKSLQVIFISGYAEDAFIDSYGTEREFNFLPKPFTLKQIASKIKEVLQK